MLQKGESLSSHLSSNVKKSRILHAKWILAIPTTGVSR